MTTDPRPLLSRMLQQPYDWKLVSTFFPADIQPSGNLTRHERERLVTDHHHVFRQIALVFEGEEYIVLRDRIYRCGPMTVAYIDAFEEHGFHAVSNARGSMSFRIDLRPGHILTRAVEREADGAERFSAYDALLKRTSVLPLEELWIILHEGETEQLSQIQRTKLLYTTGLLLVELLDGQRSGELAHRLSREDVLDKIMAFIKDSDNERPSLDLLASMSGYSRSRFVQLFKTHTGLTVRQYADQCCYELAAILTEHGMNPKQLAGRFGYSSISAFYRWRARQRRRMQNTHEKQ